MFYPNIRFVSLYLLSFSRFFSTYFIYLFFRCCLLHSTEFSTHHEASHFSICRVDRFSNQKKRDPDLNSHWIKSDTGHVQMWDSAKEKERNTNNVLKNIHHSTHTSQLVNQAKKFFSTSSFFLLFVNIFNFCFSFRFFFFFISFFGFFLFSVKLLEKVYAKNSVDNSRCLLCLVQQSDKLWPVTKRSNGKFVKRLVIFFALKVEMSKYTTRAFFEVPCLIQI